MTRDAAPMQDMHSHPLEVIPVFRRIPRSLARDLAYTLVWNVALGLAFWVLASLFSGHAPPLASLLPTLVVANLIGYSIHLLFSLGDALGIDAWLCCRGFVLRTAYYTLIPVAGVFLGYGLSALLFDVRFHGIAFNPGAMLSMLSIALVISVVMSLVFFWRERGALADAELSRERERRERIERESVAANLRALQAQVEPHFLFNTLANVSSLIDSDRAEAKRMLESFIRFLRSSLAATRAATTTLGADAELVAAYLDVIGVRMGARLRHAIDIPAELRDVPLPPMLLQPVVENAIRHGLEPKVEGGEVAVRARRAGGTLQIEVADTGVGFAAATRGGVGLTNLRERLKLLYGDRASLAISDNAGGGSVVRLTLPA